MIVELLAGTDLKFGHGRTVRAGEPMPDDVVNLPGLGREIQLGRIRVAPPSTSPHGSGSSAAAVEEQLTLPLPVADPQRKRPAMSQDANRKVRR
jgi:hypothetical protein